MPSFSWKEVYGFCLDFVTCNPKLQISAHVLYWAYKKTMQISQDANIVDTGTVKQDCSVRCTMKRIF